MGRKLRYPEVMLAKFLAGTFARIAALLRPGEDRTDFVREAVAREARRRERETARARGHAEEPDA